MTSDGLSKARLGRMHDVMAGYVERGDVPGIVTLVSRRGEVHVVILVEECRLRLDEPVDRLLPELANRTVLKRLVAEPVGTFGWDGGLGTSWRADPTEDMVGILMTQRAWTSPTPPDVCLDFWTSLYQAIDD